MSSFQSKESPNFAMHSVVVFSAILAVVSAGVITEEKASVSHEQNPAGFAYQTSEYKSAQTVLPAVPAVPTYYAAAPAALPYAYSYVKAYEPAAVPAVAVKAAPVVTEVKYEAPVVKEYKYEAPAVVKAEYNYAAPAVAVAAPVVKTEYKYAAPAPVVKTEYKYQQAAPVAAAPAFYNYAAAPAAYAPTVYRYGGAPFVPTYYNAAPYYGYGYRNYGYYY